ncbi:MAG: hypothetical protein FJX45_01730 [Alphaproteobacteria bacterium]|nr:hypothetical protein [Alphaproteobacteria bacterium]
MNQRPCANGILAAVLSASFLPIHGALAKEQRSATASGAAKHGAKKPPKSPAPTHGASAPSPDGDAAAGDKP